MGIKIEQLPLFCGVFVLAFLICVRAPTPRDSRWWILFTWRLAVFVTADVGILVLLTAMGVLR